MILRIISDVHLESHPMYILEEMAGEDEQTLILAGDIVPYYQLERELISNFFFNVSGRFKNVVYVPGNHEYYHGDINRGDGHIRKFLEQFGNVHFLNSDEITIDGVKIVGCTLWTDIHKGDPIAMSQHYRRMVDYRAIRCGAADLTPAETMYINKCDRKFLESVVDEKTVVVTHHPPSERSIHPKFRGDDLNPFFYNDMDDFIYERQPVLWVHGHTHSSMNYRIGETRILCNPKGYWNPLEYGEPENVEYNPTLIYPVSFENS